MPTRQVLRQTRWSLLRVWQVYRELQRYEATVVNACHAAAAWVLAGRMPVHDVLLQDKVSTVQRMTAGRPLGALTLLTSVHAWWWRRGPQDAEMATAGPRRAIPAWSRNRTLVVAPVVVAAVPVYSAGSAVVEAASVSVATEGDASATVTVAATGWDPAVMPLTPTAADDGCPPMAVEAPDTTADSDTADHVSGNMPGVPGGESRGSRDQRLEP